MTNLVSLHQAPLHERLNLLLDESFHTRDDVWLAHAVQTAINLEFATVPPYLCALWSIVDDTHIAARFLRNVVQEEMLHFSLMCNLLTALGHTPAIADAGSVPNYPGHLPGDIAADVEVWLGGLEPQLLQQFIDIEKPAYPVAFAESTQSAPFSARNKNHGGYATIGAFYDAILDCLIEVQPQFRTERQLSGPLAPMVIHDLSGARDAIELIKHQGEGSAFDPDVPHTENLAHYYRFLSIQHNQEVISITHNEKGEVIPKFGGDPWPPTEVWPVAKVPAGGYRNDNVPNEVGRLLHTFDTQYTDLLNYLQAAWEQGNQGLLVHSFEVMFKLTSIGRELMLWEREDGTRYGPNFQFLD